MHMRVFFGNFVAEQPRVFEEDPFSVFMLLPPLLCAKSALFLDK